MIVPALCVIQSHMLLLVKPFECVQQTTSISQQLAATFPLPSCVCVCVCVRVRVRARACMCVFVYMYIRLFVNAIISHIICSAAYKYVKNDIHVHVYLNSEDRPLVGSPKVTLFVLVEMMAHIYTHTLFIFAS